MSVVSDERVEELLEIEREYSRLRDENTALRVMVDEARAALRKIADQVDNNWTRRIAWDALGLNETTGDAK
jgi:hypothetical protein